MSKKHAQTVIIGNSVEFNIDPNSCTAEIQANVTICEFRSVRIWGQILNDCQEPVPNALVKLVKLIQTESDTQYQGIAHTVSDCDGFYQFDICSNENAWYKLLVGKSNTGKEIIIPDNSNCCTSMSDRNK